MNPNRISRNGSRRRFSYDEQKRMHEQKSYSPPRDHSDSENKGYEPPLNIRSPVRRVNSSRHYRKKSADSLKYLGKHMVKIIEDFIPGELYVPIITNLTCSYKISILGVFLSELQVVQALIRHFRLDSNTFHFDRYQSHLSLYTTIDEIIDHIYGLFYGDKNIFHINVERYACRLQLDYLSDQYKINIPIVFYNKKHHKVDRRQLWKGWRNQVYSLPEDDGFYYVEEHASDIVQRKKQYWTGDVDRIYILVSYIEFIPKDRYKAYNPGVYGGSLYTMVIGLFTREEDIVDYLIAEHFNSIIYFLRTIEPYESMREVEALFDDYATIDEMISALQSFKFSFGQLNNILKRIGISPFYIMYRYPVSISNHLLSLPLDLTKDPNVVE